MALRSPSRISSSRSFSASPQLATAVGLPQKTSHGVCRPFGAPTRGIHFPAWLRQGAVNSAARPRFVAGFQTRYVPPTPFFTTSTASSSSSRMAFFIHSHPWGLVSRLPCFRRSTTTPIRRGPSQRRRFEASPKTSLCPAREWAPERNSPVTLSGPLPGLSAQVQVGRSFPFPKNPATSTDDLKAPLRPLKRAFRLRIPLAVIGINRPPVSHAFYLVAASTFRVSPVRPPEQQTAPAHQPTPA